MAQKVGFAIDNLLNSCIIEIEYTSSTKKEVSMDIILLIIWVICAVVFFSMVVGGLTDFAKNVRRIADALEVVAYGEALSDEEGDEDEEERSHDDDLVLVPNTPTI